MQIAIITDIHFGKRNNNEILLNHQEDFFRDVFFKTLNDRGITTIFNAGDSFDQRKQINFMTLHRSFEMYYKKIQDYGMTEYTILGNHDTFFKNTNDVNAISLIHQFNDCVQIIDKPKTMTFGSKTFLFVPWIADDDTTTMSIVAESKADYAIAHIPVNGAVMDRFGTKSPHGFSPGTFSHFKEVWTGHFHTKSLYHNIRYLGAPFNFDWGDYDDARGFHIYDTETDTLEFIQNPKSIFKVVRYDDSVTIDDDLRGCYVRVMEGEITDQARYVSYVEKLKTLGLSDLKIISAPVVAAMDDGEHLELDEVESTRTIIMRTIDTLDNIKDEERTQLKDMMLTYYSKALSL